MEPRASAEVVVIGAGFAGAATAWALTQRGICDIVILEREETWGVHASGRNAAMCRQLSGDRVVSDYTVSGAAFLASPPEGFCDTPLLNKTGSFLLCQDAAAVARLAKQAQQRQLDYELLAVDALEQRWPLLAELRSAGGVHFPSDGIIDIHTLLQSFIRGARLAGAQFCLSTEATGFRPTGEDVVVETTRGAIRASCVVDAAGAWAGVLGGLAGCEASFQPYRRHLFLTEALTGVVPDAPFVWLLGDDEFYARPEGAGLLLSACEEDAMTPRDVRADPAALEYLAAKVNGQVPALAEAGIARTWACLRTFAPDRRPLIGWDAAVPWLFFVAGLGGHGATGSSSIGEAAAAAIASHLR